MPPDAKKVNYRRPGFVKKFLELQAVMWRTNAGLTDRHAYDSRPRSWPTLRRGINLFVLPCEVVGRRRADRRVAAEYHI